MAKEQRRKKVFIDWSQNADYKTTVAVYSLRAKREEPFVSMPATWDEVSDGKFTRWILRPDRSGGERLIAMPAGSFLIDPAYHRGEVPPEWRTRIRIEDIGSYEVIAGSQERRDLALWFSGKHLAGEWRLHKTTGEEHRSWRLEPRHDRVVQRLNRRGR